MGLKVRLSEQRNLKPAPALSCMCRLAWQARCPAPGASREASTTPPNARGAHTWCMYVFIAYRPCTSPVGPPGYDLTTPYPCVLAEGQKGGPGATF
jgi:hypothetical protein